MTWADYYAEWTDDQVAWVWNEDDPNEAVRAEARRIRELLREPFRVGERRRALLETELVAWARTRERKVA